MEQHVIVEFNESGASRGRTDLDELLENVLQRGEVDHLVPRRLWTSTSASFASCLALSMSGTRWRFIQLWIVALDTLQAWAAFVAPPTRSTAWRIGFCVPLNIALFPFCASQILDKYFIFA
nr:hypothetical protein [Ralstonia mannitolilytica]